MCALALVWEALAAIACWLAQSVRRSPWRRAQRKKQSTAWVYHCRRDLVFISFFFCASPRSSSSSPRPGCPSVQLRVVRAFKSTLEDMEDQRSVHSLHSLHSSRSHPGGRPMSDISFIDEEAKSPSPQSDPLPADLVSPRHNGRARDALLFLRRGPSLHSGNHLPSSAEFAPLVAERNSSEPATPRSALSASSSSSSTSSSAPAAAPDNNNRASFSNPLTQGYNLLAEPPVNKLHETSI